MHNKFFYLTLCFACQKDLQVAYLMIRTFKKFDILCNTVQQKFPTLTMLVDDVSYKNLEYGLGTMRKDNAATLRTQVELHGGRVNICKGVQSIEAGVSCCHILNVALSMVKIKSTFVNKECSSYFHHTHAFGASKYAESGVDPRKQGIVFIPSRKKTIGGLITPVKNTIGPN